MIKPSIFIYFILGINILSSCSELSGTNHRSSENKPPSDTFLLQPGDLLFQDIDCGAFCDAIEKVTFGVGNANFSHIGLVVNDKNGKLMVLEAVSKGVIETPLDTFFNRSFDADRNPKVVVGRLKTELRNLIEPAITSAFQRLGKPYDEIFDIQNDKYYCSELIYFAFKDANEGKPIFDLQPMTFNDPGSGLPFPVWEEYYKDLRQPIPEGQPGLNPGGISLSESLEIVHYFGKPDVKKAPGD